MSLAIRRNHLNSFIAVVTIILFLVLVWDVWKWVDDSKINDQIALLKQGDWVEAKELDLNSVNVLLAYAALQIQLQLFDQAIETYSQAERLASHQQLTHIYYNLGNLHLLQAIAYGQDIKVDRAVAMADVAKGYYRSALINQPDFWDAKYNYEAAQRLSRDLPLGDLRENEEAQESSAELWSAMPGFPIGLP